MAPMLVVVHTRLKGTRPPTRAAMRRKVLAGGTQRLRGPTLPRAVATAAVALLMLAAGGGLLPAGGGVVAGPMAVAAVLTAIVKISEISIFQKGPSLLNAAGLLLC